MCSSGQLCSGNGRPPPNSSSNDPHNSGSQYALCALGVGLVALGIVMIVWSVVPSDVSGNSSTSKPDLDTKGKTSSVAFVLVGTGVAMLLLSICLGVRSKHRQQRREAQALEGQLHNGEAAAQAGETEEEMAARYDVPTYEEAVGSGQYPVRQSNPRSSSSQLPSYEDLVDGIQHEDEGGLSAAGPAPAQPPTSPEAQPAPGAAAVPSGRQNGLRKLRPLKVRRIKSEKLHLKNIRDPPQAGPPSIEPLTPPPQYDDSMPEL
ncbi:hypothetical protein JZ751_014956 [Albula glossodonta]|uniref:Transmembrane protein 51 n=1 Tax=Albula glossodonta TaxID=121402 RepID=A0A8T2N8M6_9TELE|nr:hypothetical protein JZ751_014956 [Albula glossodonta]